MSTGLENKFKFDFDKPDFQKQFGGKDGTLSEKRKEAEAPKGGDAADIIGASAEGLDSITNFVSLFTGRNPTTETNYTPPPPEQKKMNPLFLVGGAAVVVLLIILLISSKNGKATK